MGKTIKTIIFTGMAAAVLCAGTVSARQLRSDANGFACGGSCGPGKPPCKTGCICAFPLESNVGFCSTHPTGVQPPAK